LAFSDEWALGCQRLSVSEVSLDAVVAVAVAVVVVVEILIHRPRIHE
jgi:hypothetical protein